jgi:hypothetical protein
VIGIDDFLSRFEGVKGGNNQWQARCPCRNDDENPSLAIAYKDERILVNCFRGSSACSAQEICKEVGVSIADLMPDKPKEQRLSKVAEYDYYDEAGELLFQKVRYIDQDGRKTFRQRRPVDGGQWEYSLGDTPKVLYNLPAVRAAIAENKSIYVVEGEKDADALIARGLVATTMPGGAGKWLEIHTMALAGGTIDIVADNDEVGHEHGADVFRKLQEAGCDVALWRCPSKKDVFDHLAAGLKLDELVPLDPDGLTELVSAEVPSEETPLTQAIEKIAATLLNPDLTPQQKLLKAALISTSAATEQPLHLGRLVKWQDFVKEELSSEPKWVIDGVLQAQERVIVVAAEGVGKTMLMRQVAILTGAGIHPFTFQPMQQRRTLFVDLENPEHIIHKMSSQIFADVEKMGYVKNVESHIWMYPSGLNLLNKPDRQLLEEQIEKTRPELICMGPLYKSFVDPGGRTSESIVVEIAKYFDYIRTVYNTALWFEHHAPLGTTMATRDLRPFGSAVWSRWPEFGIALSPVPTGEPYVYDIRHFRGARDERAWPSLIKRSPRPGGRFPFTVLEYLKV